MWKQKQYELLHENETLETLYYVVCHIGWHNNEIDDFVLDQ